MRGSGATVASVFHFHTSSGVYGDLGRLNGRILRRTTIKSQLHARKDTYTADNMLKKLGINDGRLYDAIFVCCEVNRVRDL